MSHDDENGEEEALLFPDTPAVDEEHDEFSRIELDRPAVTSALAGLSLIGVNA